MLIDTSQVRSKLRAADTARAELSVNPQLSPPSGRAVPLSDLGWLCRAALALLELKKAGAEDRVALLESSLVAQCAACNICLTGAELLLLARPVTHADGQDPRAGRLLQGYCARSGCNSYFYSLELRPGSGIDWPALEGVRSSIQDAAQNEADAQCAAQKMALAAKRRTAGLRAAARIAVGAGAILLLLVLRQWYIGGTIPLIREPGTFLAVPESLDLPTE